MATEKKKTTSKKTTKNTVAKKTSISKKKALPVTTESAKALVEPEEADKAEFLKKVEETGDRVHEFLARLPRALKVTKNDTLEMHQEIDEGARVRSIAYWLFIITAVGIASLGLILNSPAVIIGAMLVSPLMAPIISFGMSIAIGDFYMGLRAIIILTLSILVSILTSAAITLMIPITEPTTEILSRTNPTLLDLFIALLSGLVAALSSVKSKGEEILSKAGPGAAIGVALMPPLCVVGYGIGVGLEQDIMWGAFLLFITNMFAIVMISSIFYYFLYTDYNISSIIKKLNSKREDSDFLFKWFKSSPFWKYTHGSLSSAKRFIFPVLLLALVSYPLYSSFQFLKKKFEVRRTINEYLDQVQGMNVIRGTDKLIYKREQVSGTLIFSSQQIPPKNYYTGLNQIIQQKFSNYNAKITLVRVAGETDISELKNVALKNQQLTQQNQQLFLETVPELMQNSIRERHATELVSQIKAAMQKNFPPTIGILSHVSVLYSSLGMDTIQVYYIGEKQNAEKQQLVEKALHKEASLLFRNIKQVQLIFLEKYQNQIGCQNNHSPKEVERALSNLTERISLNPKLDIDLKIQKKMEYIVKLEFSQIPKNIKINYLDKKDKCLLTYEYKHPTKTPTLKEIPVE